MKNVKFKGPDTNLGRFGQITKGDKLLMFEWEYDAVARDDRFKLLDPEPSTEELEIAAKIKPWGTGNFDLRTVPYDEPKLPRKLISRTSKIRLLHICKAIVEVGGVIDEFDIRDDRTTLADKIVVAYRYMGWNKISRADRLALPTLKEVQEGDAPLPEPPPEKEEDENEDESKETEKVEDTKGDEGDEKETVDAPKEEPKKKEVKEPVKKQVKKKAVKKVAKKKAPAKKAARVRTRKRKPRK